MRDCRCSPSSYQGRRGEPWLVG